MKYMYVTRTITIIKTSIAPQGLKIKGVNMRKQMDLTRVTSSDGIYYHFPFNMIYIVSYDYSRSF